MVGYDNSRYGVTANVGYDTKGENIRGGLGLRVIFQLVISKNRVLYLIKN